MSTLQVRDLPEDVYQALAFRAEREHRSLAQQAIVELRRMPELEGRDRRRRTLERIKADLTGRPAAGPAIPPEALIREDRER